MSEARPPRQRVGPTWFTFFTVAWLVIWTVQLTPLQLLLPLQLDTPDSASGWVQGVVYSGLILGIGGLAGVIAGPLSGALSDRQLGPRPRRRPWALLGVWIATVCLILTGFSTTPLAIGAAWIGVSIGVSVASAAFTAMIADQLPEEQRGAAASAASSAQALGIVLGVGAVVLLGLSVFTSYAVLAVLMCVLGTTSALLLPDPSGRIVAPRLTDAARFAFLQDRDFCWMLAGRLVVNIGNALGTSLFLFFLLYGIGQPHSEAEDNLLLVVVVYTVFVVAASVLAGLVSDRMGRRRSLAVAAACVQATSGVLLVIAPTFTVTLFAAAIMGIGYGAFSTVGLAFATDLLPSERNHGRDLGVVNTVMALGQLLGPIFGALLVAAVGGFWLVFTVATALSLVGAGLTGLARERPRATPLSSALNS